MHAPMKGVEISTNIQNTVYPLTGLICKSFVQMLIRSKGLQCGQTVRPVLSRLTNVLAPMAMKQSRCHKRHTNSMPRSKMAAIGCPVVHWSR